MDQDAHESIRAGEHNRRAWDALVARRQRFTTPAKDQDIANAPLIAAGDAWLDGGVAGRRLLCLAAGGGRQSAFYAAAGADVTVVDISSEMLALDRHVAAERGLAIRAIQASMDDLSALGAGEFDLVIQPVSTCYVPDVTRVYREVARVTRIGGIYISQHKQPASLQADVRPATRGYELVEPYYRRGPLPPVVGSPHREEGTAEFLHRWEELVGELCRGGFVIEDLLEPVHAEAKAAPGTFAHRSRYVAPYVRIKARRVAPSQNATTRPRSEQTGIWTPEQRA
ncbi:MAG: class I SAM-dependent methyltransferase [Planctomycetia bacterium]|nr:class I SAM-dependent methyltransferase [Planctomycetia bacterium]